MTAAVRRIRVLIADDSLFVRVALRRLLSADGQFEIVGEAADGQQAIDQVLALRPDVCTMDVDMPGLSGVAAVREIMRRCPTPVLVLSAHTQAGTREALEALSAGAVDVLAKPAGPLTLSGLGPALIHKLRAAAAAFISGPAAPAAAPQIPVRRSLPGLDPILIVALSTGGPALLSEVLPRLSASCRPLVIVQHMPAQFTRALAERLAGLCPAQVREARTGDRPARGLVLIAPGDHHLVFAPDGAVQIIAGPEVHGVRPAADVTMRSAAQVFGRRAAGLVLTGMGRDGTDGLAAIRAAGGATYAQDRDSSLVFGMPRSAIEAGVADRVITKAELADLLG